MAENAEKHIEYFFSLRIPLPIKMHERAGFGKKRLKHLQPNI
jgi:hypothetical protein